MQESFFVLHNAGDTFTQNLCTVTLPLRKVLDLEETRAAASGMFRNACSKEPPYHTAEEVWEELKQGDEGGRLLFTLLVRLHNNKSRLCGVQKAVESKGRVILMKLLCRTLLEIACFDLTHRCTTSSRIC